MSSTVATEQRLRIRDFSDREILALFADVGGKAPAREVALRVFGLREDDEAVKHSTRCVTSRLCWMRRYGLIDRAEDGDWLVSAMGEQLRRGRVPESMATGIDRMEETKGLDLANVVGIKLLGAGEVTGRAMQRELTHQINRRRSRNRGW